MEGVKIHSLNLTTILKILIMKHEIYKCHLITKMVGYYWALTQPFETLKQAKLFIDKFEL